METGTFHAGKGFNQITDRTKELHGLLRELWNQGIRTETEDEWSYIESKGFWNAKETRYFNFQIKISQKDELRIRQMLMEAQIQEMDELGLSTIEGELYHGKLGN